MGKKNLCFVHLRPLPNSQIPKFSNRQFYSIFFWFLTRNFLEMPEGLNWYEKWLIQHSDIMAPLKNLWLKTRKIANKFGNLRIWKFENLAKVLNEHNTRCLKMIFIGPCVIDQCCVHLRLLPNSQIAKFSNCQIYWIFFWFLVKDFLKVP